MSQTVEQTNWASPNGRFQNVIWTNTWKNDDPQQQKKVFDNLKKSKEEYGEVGNNEKNLISFLLDNSKNPVPTPSPSASSAPPYTKVQYLNLNAVGYSNGWSMNNTASSGSLPSQKRASTTIVPPSKTISPQIPPQQAQPQQQLPSVISPPISSKISPVVHNSKSNNNTHSNNHNNRRKSSEVTRETSPDSSSNETSSVNGGIEEEISNQNLYKTELCRSWKETGECRYGQKCQFAHGEHEMRLIMRHPKYKTESCKTYAAFGSCPYRERCRFLHPEDSSLSRSTSSAKTSPPRNDSPPTHLQQSPIQAPSVPFPVASSSSFLSTERSRLSIFQSLTEE